MASVARRNGAAKVAAHQPHDGPCRGLVGVRCSTDEQLDRYGPDVQRDACLALAAREGIAVDHLADVVVISQSVTKYAAASGGEALDGAFYAEILERLKTGRYCAYLTYDMTRLTRSGVMHQLLLEEEVKRHAPRILYANLSGVDTTTPEGEAFKNIMAVLNRLRTVLDLARLASARHRQATAGFYSGESVALGYILELDAAESARRKRPTYRRVAYPPHVSVLTKLLEAIVAYRGSPYRAARALAHAGVIIPDFPPDLADVMATRSSLKLALRVDGGWKITPKLIRRAAQNPAYGGSIQWNGVEVGRDERLALVDPGLLSAAAAALSGGLPKPRGRAAALDRDPRPLAGLLYCLGPADRAHATARRAAGLTGPDRYACRLDYERTSDRSPCLQVAARILDEPVAEFVLGQLRLGSLGDDVVAELEREQTDRAARDEERSAGRRRLAREVDALEANLNRLLASEVLSPERFASIDRQITAKRAELAALSTPSESEGGRHLGVDQLTLVRAFVDRLGAHWPTLSAGTRNELLRAFLDRIEVSHDGALLTLRLRWITGHEELLRVVRPDYQAGGDAPWTAEQDRALWALFPTATWPELYAALPGRSQMSIRHQAMRLGLHRERPSKRGGLRGPRFTAEDDALLDRYGRGELSWCQLRELTGRTEYSLRARLAARGVRRVGPRSLPAVNWHVLTVAADDAEMNCVNPSKDRRPR